MARGATVVREVAAEAEDLAHEATKESVPTRVAVLGLAADPMEKNVARLLRAGSEATLEVCPDLDRGTGTNRQM